MTRNLACLQGKISPSPVSLFGSPGNQPTPHQTPTKHWAGCTDLNVKGLLLKICTVLRTLVVLRVDPAGRLPTSAQRSARMRGVKNTCHLHAAWAVQPWSLDGCRLVCHCWPRFYRRAMINTRSQMIVRTRIVLARCSQWAGKDS